MLLLLVICLFIWCRVSPNCEVLFRQRRMGQVVMEAAGETTEKTKGQGEQHKSSLWKDTHTYRVSQSNKFIAGKFFLFYGYFFNILEWPQTLSVTEGDLELLIFPASIPGVLLSQACATLPGSCRARMECRASWILDHHTIHPQSYILAPNILKMKPKHKRKMNSLRFSETW